MISRRIGFLAAIAFCATAAAGRADLVVSFVPSPITVPVGGTAAFDLVVHSSNAVSGDDIDSFGFDLILTRTGATQTRLEFATTGGGNPNGGPDQPSVYNSIDNYTYVFKGNSGNENNGPQPLGVVGTSSVPNDEYSGGDLTNTNGTTAHIGLTDVLLAHVILKAPPQGTFGASPPKAGDTFTVTLSAATGGSFFTNGNNEVAYNSLTPPSANILITPAGAVVPEPSGLVLLGLGLLGVFATRRGRAGDPKAA